ncbi:MAG: hypothetical protein K2Q10_05270 [Rhodospirillales bacterium]|nr:hypothetical protein [Rhodospirillales bacterium]
MEEGRAREELGVAAEGVDRETGLQGRSARDILMASKDQALMDAQTMIRDTADSQKMKAADTLGNVAEALHHTAASLRDGKQDYPAQYADMAADQVERMAQMLRDKSWNNLMSDAEGFARRQPWLFVGGALAAGFLTARFLKSSTRPGASPYSPVYPSSVEAAAGMSTASSSPYEAGYGTGQSSPLMGGQA